MRRRSCSAEGSRGARVSTAHWTRHGAAASRRTLAPVTTCASSWTWRAEVFTGLVEELGRVQAVEERPDGRRLWISATLVTADMKIGDSIACSGCCLTAVAVEPTRFAVEAVPETLRRTTLGSWRPHTPVNLERSLRLADRPRGHPGPGPRGAGGQGWQGAAEGLRRRLTPAPPAATPPFLAAQGGPAA